MTVFEEDRMEKLPTHLEKIFKVTEREDTYLSGRIVCECGCETFGVRYFGEPYPPHCVGVNKVGDRYALVLKSVCRGCGKEHELYDFSKHAYDGLICGDGVSVPNDKLVDACAGDERDFKIEMSVEFDDEEQFTEEVVDDPPEGMSFKPDDRFNIWSWIVVWLIRAKSGEKLEFINDELA